MTGNEQNDFQRMANAMLEYFMPELNRLYASKTEMKRATVASAASGGKIGVQFAFDVDGNGNPKILYLPYVSSMASAAVGSAVWVLMPTGSLSSAVVFGDGTLSNL